MRKRILIDAIAFAVILMLIVPSVFAISQEQGYGNSVIYVHDLGNLLDSSEELDLVSEFGPMCEDISYNVLFLTTKNADGKSTMTWSDDYMDKLFPHDENNIAFIIDMDNREIYINTMGNAILCLTDRMIDTALDDGYRYIQEYEYADCLMAMANYCIPRLSDNPEPIENIVDYDSETESRIEFKDALVGGLLPSAVIAGVVCFVLVSRHNKANKVQSATVYMSKNNYSIIDKNEIFIRSYKKVHKNYYKPKSSSSSSGGRSGGSSHRSSSGRSHGGGGRKF